MLGGSRWQVCISLFDSVLTNLNAPQKALPSKSCRGIQWHMINEMPWNTGRVEAIEQLSSLKHSLSSSALNAEDVCLGHGLLDSQSKTEWMCKGYIVHIVGSKWALALGPSYFYRCWRHCSHPTYPMLPCPKPRLHMDAEIHPRRTKWPRRANFITSSTPSPSGLIWTDFPFLEKVCCLSSVDDMMTYSGIRTRYEHDMIYIYIYIYIAI